MLIYFLHIWDMNSSQFLIEDLADLSTKIGRIIECIGEYNIVLLKGDLGAGKTKLVSEICRHLQIEDEVSSPTFSIINEYVGQANKRIYHIDLYRLENTEEAINIGIEDYLFDGSTCYIEWPEIIEHLIDIPHLTIEIRHQPDDKRIIDIRET